MVVPPQARGCAPATFGHFPLAPDNYGGPMVEERDSHLADCPVSWVHFSFADWPTPLQIADYAKRGTMAALGANNSELVSEGAYPPVRFLELSATLVPRSTSNRQPTF